MLLDRAVRLHIGGDYRGSIPYYIRAVRQAEQDAKLTGAPVDPDVLHAAGVALAMAGKRAEAIEFLESALQNGKSKSGAVWSALGLAYVESRQLGRAERCYRLACRADPESVANWTGYANLAACGGDLSLAERRYQLALDTPARDAEELMAQAMTQLRRGHWRKGWRGYEARRSTGMWAERNSHAAKLRTDKTLVEYTYWRLPDKGDRVLVLTEQGVGDAVQFARYVPAFAERFGVVVHIHAYDQIVDLLAGGLPGITVADRASGVPEGTAGWALMLSLPAMLRESRISVVPPPIRPFGLQWTRSQGERQGEVPDNAPTAGFKSLMVAPYVPRPRVFVHSRGNALHGYDFDRSAPAGVLEDAVRGTGGEVVGAKFSGGAIGAGEREIVVEPSWRSSVDALLGCDYCVTVDTGLAHVAGSLGVPTLLCVPTIPEWRWGRPGATTTPWYPSVTLVRRSRTDRWDEVAVVIASKLMALQPEVQGADVSAVG